MAYDAARRVTVLFGGQSTGLLGDTWEWSGTAWTLRANTGPSPRTGVAMAYDSRRNVTVLFGGNDGAFHGTALSDTWEWNGATWTQRLVAGPSARGEQGMAYDSHRGVVVLFGGALSGNLGNSAETWEWDGSAWAQRSVPGPAPINGHRLAYDANRGVTVFFGVYPTNGGQSTEAQTWEWNGVSWTQRSATSPPPRGGMGMAYAPDRATSVIFGGAAGLNAYLGDTWEWNGTTWVQVALNGPSPRFLPAMAYHAPRHSFVLFGGSVSSSGISGETWELGLSGCASDLDDGSGTGTPDGGVTIDDLLYFLARFDLGC